MSPYFTEDYSVYDVLGILPESDNSGSMRDTLMGIHQSGCDHVDHAVFPYNVQHRRLRVPVYDVRDDGILHVPGQRDGRAA